MKSQYTSRFPLAAFVMGLLLTPLLLLNSSSVQAQREPALQLMVKSNPTVATLGKNVDLTLEILNTGDTVVQNHPVSIFFSADFALAGNPSYC